VQLFQLRRDIKKSAYYGALALAFLTMLGGWWLLSLVLHGEQAVFIPSPQRVLAAAGELIQDDEFFLDVKMSFLRVTGGFFLAAALAIPLGISWDRIELSKAFCNRSQNSSVTSLSLQ